MTTEQQRRTSSQDATQRSASPSAVSPTRLQRRPMLLALGVLIVTAGAVAGWFMWVSTSTAAEVVAVRESVDRGQEIVAEDLTTVRVALDPSLQTVPAAELEALVGQRAASDLTAGTLLAPGQVTSELVPGSGMSVVAVPVPSGLVPTGPIRAGDRVRLVQTPGPAGEVTDVPVAVAAEVVNVTLGDSTTVIDVLVPADVAADLAARAATGRVALVLDSRVR